MQRKGCGRKLAPEQWWNYCGETDMGQTGPALCTKCGGPFRLEEQGKWNQEAKKQEGQ